MPGDAALQGNASPDLVRFADAVLSEGKSLLLVRPDSDALHNISQSLQSLWLAHAPQLKVEHFSGRLSAGLLGLINASLAHQALPEVMQGNPHQPPQHLCLVHDAECLSLDELLLLQRVIEHFPGWQIRLVLLFKIALDTSEKFNALLQQPGKGLVIWQLHAPAPKSASAGRDRALKPALVGLGSLVVLGAAVIWLRPPTNVPGNLGATPKATASQTLLSSSAPADSVMAQGGPGQTATPATAVPAAPPGISPTATSPLFSGGASPQRPEAALAPVPDAPVPDAAVRGHRWLSALPQDFFVMIHSSHEQLQQAQRTIEAKPELGNARLIMLTAAAAETPPFVVVTGPFRTEERAQNYKTRQKLPASARIETVNNVLKQSRTDPKAKP